MRLISVEEKEQQQNILNVGKAIQNLKLSRRFSHLFFSYYHYFHLIQSNTDYSDSQRQMEKSTLQALTF